MRESTAHRAWRAAGRPDRYYEAEVFNVDPETAEHVDVRLKRFTSHSDAELWMIAKTTPHTPFAQARTTRIHDTIIDIGDDHVVDIHHDDPDGWCYLDNAASAFEREGDWLPQHPERDIQIEHDPGIDLH